MHTVIPKHNLVSLQKKTFEKNEAACRDGISKKQPNKVGMTQQYFYELPSLQCQYLVVLVTWDDRR